MPPPPPHFPVSRRGRGFSLVEVLLGVTLFVFLFTHIMMAFTPTATDYHSLVRGYTTAMNVANWYINHVEGLLNYEGRVPDADLGVREDVTAFVKQNYGPGLELLHRAQIFATVDAAGKSGKGLYEIMVEIHWGKTNERPHRYSLRRLKAGPGF